MSEARIEAYKLFKTAIKPFRKYKLSTRFPINHIYNFVLPRITPHLVRVIEINGYKMQIKLDNKDADGVGQLLVFDGHFEVTQTELIKSIVKPGMTVIDVGANIGYYTLLMSQLVKDGWVYGIEPEANNIQKLIRNIDLNKYHNISIFPVAVGESIKDVDFFVSGMSTGRHSIILSRKDGGYKTTIHMTTLDHLIDKPIDFIKSDAEGNDLNVMIGAKELIKRSPNLKWVMEIWAVGLSKLGQTVKDVFDTAHEYGFKRYTMIDDNNDRLISLNGNTLETVNKYLKYRNSVNVLFEK